jgi:ferric-dicitrate binding protein FerR (iron transport regulator)/outer membrane protein assembly factor BamD (BamD/ComL family)
MTTENQDDRTVRAVDELRAAYDGTSLPDEVKGRIEGAVFAPRSRKPGPMQLAVAFGLAAAILAVAAVWLFYPRTSGDEPTTPETARYTAVVLELTGDADVTSPHGADALPATARMRLDGESTVTTSPLSAVVLRVGPHEVTVKGDTRFDLASLDRAALRFGIDWGRAHFDVAHLAPGERLAVTAGGLTVEVVGTRFDVFFDGGCPAVSVDEGELRASFRKEVSSVAAGASRRFCEPASSESAAVAATVSPDSPVGTDGAGLKTLALQGDADGDTNEAKILSGASAADTGTAAGAPPPDKAPISEEERVYLEALASRVRGDLALASAQMADYLERYPSGAFAEEALFSLVRLDYRRSVYAEVQERGASYLERYPARNAKSDEVRILYAESLHRLGVHPVIAVEILAPLVGDVDSVAGPYREQALYLYFTSAAAIGRAAEAKRAASSYLERYPGGQYAAAATALAEGK